ncbi:MAG: glycosyltransferase [Patescibacteria group bacterium]
MKIAIANNLYFPFNRGGAETVIKKMISDFKSQNHEVFLITTKPKNEKDPINLDLKIYYLQSDYSRLAEFSPLRKILWHFTNIFSFRNTDLIKKIFEEEKPDLVLTHNLMGLGFMLPLVIKDLKIKHHHYLHDIQLLYPSGLMMFGEEKVIDGISSKIYQLFTRLLFSSPNKIISPSAWLLKQHLSRAYFKKSETEIKNLVEINKNNNEILKNNRDKYKFLFVGQIEKHKGIILLIESFKEALKIKPDLKLSVVGDGKILNEVKKLSEGYIQIEFLGRLDSLEVKNTMTACACLIIPSLCYENAPTTIFEAHDCGLKVLAANIGGIPEIINSNDLLFNPGDIEDLKNKILSISQI